MRSKPIEHGDHTFSPTFDKVDTMYNYSELAFYPSNTLHAEIFARSEVREGGPNTIHPGSVAVLSLNFDPINALMQINYIQFSVRVNSPPELTPSLFRQYAGARHNLLGTALDQAIQLGMNKVYPYSVKGQNRIILEELIATRPLLKMVNE